MDDSGHCFSWLGSRIGPRNLGAPAPRRRGRKSLRNRTMDLTAHRNADWEDSKLTSDWDPPYGFRVRESSNLPQF